MRVFKAIFVFLFCGVLSLPHAAQAQLLTGFSDAEPVLTPQYPQVREPISSTPQRLTGFVSQSPKPLVVQAPLPQPQPQSLNADPNATPIDLRADHLSHDDQTGIVTASGDVMIVQADRILRADVITYDLNAGVATAAGNVVLNEPSGDIYLSDSVTLSNEMRDGFVEAAQGYLADGSRFWAERVEHKDAEETSLFKARYTACDVVCTDGSEKAPAWQIKARNVTHDKVEKTIAYEDATFEAFGVPVGYFPYFSHPDGTIRSKSGFLSPSLGFDSDLGAYVENQYYWAIADDRDATIGLVAMTEENPMVTAEYRQQFDDAALRLNGSLTSSDRPDISNGLSAKIDDEIRGHLFGRARWDINSKWRAGMDVEYSSDDQYLRQYNITNEDVLQSQLYAERFSGRNYGVARLLKFQDVRVRANQEDQPTVLPEIIVDFVGEPDSVPIIGGNWRAGGSILGLYRDGADQDVARSTVNVGWGRRLISDYGLVYDLDANARGDVYNVGDAPALSSVESGTVTRGFGNFHAEASYPMQKQYEKFQVRIAPLTSLTLSTNADNDDIPNEDSQDVQIDPSNLFNSSRFPGFDRVEDQSRLTYGMRSGLYGYDGSYINVFAGQSFGFDDEDNPFPAGSGLDEQDSDYVGEIAAQYKDSLSLNYRFQLDNEKLSPARQEVDFYGGNDRVSVNARYLFAKALAGTDINESREQLDIAGGYYFSPRWRGRAGGIYDFGESEEGLREAFVGVDYLGQCLSFSLTGERELVDDATGDGGTEILFRIGLKNLGEFLQSTYNPSLRQDDSDLSSQR